MTAERRKFSDHSVEGRTCPGRGPRSRGTRPDPGRRAPIASARPRPGTVRRPGGPPGRCRPRRTRALRCAIRADAGLPYLITWEDARARHLVEALAESALDEPAPCYVWNLTQGLRRAGEPIGEPSKEGDSLAGALAHAARGREPGVYLIQDARKFSSAELAQMTEHYTASEIEQVVVNSTLSAVAAGRPASGHDLLVAMGAIVPLSRTMVRSARSAGGRATGPCRPPARRARRPRPERCRARDRPLPAPA